MTRIKITKLCNNIFMRGRLFSIKKTTWLKLSFILNLILFIVTTTVTLLFTRQYDLWFFIFCIFIGVHLIIRGALFKFDSSCYFGYLLLFVGAFYIYCLHLNILSFYSVFVIIAFALASLFTAHFYRQTFHYFLSFSLLFLSIGLILYLINLISLWIFLAIIGVVVISLVCRLLTI